MVFLIILIASFILQLALPWWLMVLVCFVTCGLIGKTAKISFWHSFLAILLLWAGMALYQTIPNENLLATRVAHMLGFHFWWWPLIISSLLGGLVAGISGYCGYHFRKAVIVVKKSNA